YLIFPNNQGSQDTIVVKGSVLSLDAQPDTLDFGSHYAGTAPNDTITITNRDTVPLILQSPSLTGAGAASFQVATPLAGDTILSQNSIRPIIRYTPNGTICDTALLIFRSVDMITGTTYSATLLLKGCNLPSPIRLSSGTTT